MNSLLRGLMSGDVDTNRPLPSLILLGIVDFCCILIGLEQISDEKIAKGTIWIVVGIGSGLIGYYWRQIWLFLKSRARNNWQPKYLWWIGSVVILALTVSVGTGIYRHYRVKVEAVPSSTQADIDFIGGYNVKLPALAPVAMPDKFDLHWLFAEHDFAQYFRPMIQTVVTANGKKNDLESAIFIDIPSRSQFVGFYLPGNVDTYAVCKVLADAPSKLVEHFASGHTLVGNGIFDKSQTPLADLRSTGRVYVYYEGDLPLPEAGELTALFESKHLGLILRGDEWLRMGILSRRDSPPVTTQNNAEQFSPSPPSSRSSQRQAQSPDKSKKNRQSASVKAATMAATDKNKQAANLTVQKPAPPPPTQSQECAPGAYCAQSTGQQGGITGQVFIGVTPPVHISWEIADREGQPEAIKDRVFVKIWVDQPLNAAFFGVVCDHPCKAVWHWVFGSGISQVGENPLMGHPEIAGFKVSMPNPMGVGVVLYAGIDPEDKNTPIRVLDVKQVTVQQP